MCWRDVLDSAVHDRFDWQQRVVRCSDNRDEIVNEVIEPIPDQGNLESLGRESHVPMDEERLNDHTQVRDEQKSVHRVR